MIKSHSRDVLWAATADVEQAHAAAAAAAAAAAVTAPSKPSATTDSSIRINVMQLSLDVS
jgi:hypothetical protein